MGSSLWDLKNVGNPMIKNNYLYNILIFMLLTISAANLTYTSHWGLVTSVMHNALIVFMFLLLWSLIYFRPDLAWLYQLVGSMALIIGFQFLVMFINDDMNLVLFIRFIGLFAFILLSSLIKWEYKHFLSISVVLSIFNLYFLYDYFTNGTSYRFSSIFRNPNALAIYLLFFIFFFIVTLVLSKKIYIKLLMGTMLLLAIFLLINTDSRAVQLSLLLVVGLYLLDYIKPKLFKYLDFIIITFNLLFTFIYVALYSTAIGNKLNAFVFELTTKSLFSGRELIWSEMFYKVLEKPLFGHGISMTADMFTTGGRGAHNLYMQILLEVGVVGFAVYVFFFHQIWKLFIMYSTGQVGKWSSYFYIAFLFYQNFELSFFQNGFQMAMVQWWIITIGLGYHSYRSRMERREILY